MESYWWKKANEQANTTEVDVVNLFLSSIDSLSDSDNIWFLDCANINRVNRPIYPVFWGLFPFYPVFSKLA